MADLAVWLESSLTRVFPGAAPSARHSLCLIAPRGGRVSFQVCIRNLRGDREAPIDVSLEVPDEVRAFARRVGLVPQAHLNTATEIDELDGLGQVPGLVPDPLFPETSTTLGPLETQSFWISVSVPREAPAGRYRLIVRIKPGEGRSRQLRTDLEVCSLVLHPVRDLLVGHWFYPDAISDFHRIEPYDSRFWSVAEPYFADYFGHGNNTMFVPHFTPPINGEHRPQQLVGVRQRSAGLYSFHFSNVRKWVAMARKHGAAHFFWSHLFTQWGAKSAVRVYTSNADPESLLWPKDTGATSDVYRSFLRQYLPGLKRFLQSEGLMEVSFLQISDEPFGEEALENYRAAQQMVRSQAPWIRTMDAVSDIRFCRQGYCDMPIAGLTHSKAFREESLPHCVYFCCGPRGRWLNRLLDTPLIKIRMTGWLLYRLRAAGFMHWGYNYWYRGCTDQMLDPYLEQAYGEWPFIPYGDPFVVYPGPNGPVDSIRWEVFADSISDYSLLQGAGIRPDDPLLTAIREYNDFPKTERWLNATIRKLLA